MTGETQIVDAIDTAQEIDAGAAVLADEAAENVVKRLATLPPLDYDREREAAARRIGVRVATLDTEVDRARAAVRTAVGNDDEAGGLVLADPEPWPEPVEGGQLLADLVATVTRYLVLPSGAADTIAAWMLHAHLHDTASISPILAITSPSPECGKTTLLELLGALVPRPLTTSNITAAALFRAIEKWCPTMLVDEADTFLRDSDDLRGVLNSGHRRSGAFVVRTVGEDYEPRQFHTWAPKAIALIGRLPATLESRAIEIGLRRKTVDEQVDELRADRLGQFEVLRRQCARFAADAAAIVRLSDPDLPPALHGRTADNWRHLIAIADAAGGEWPHRIRQAATASAADRTEQTAGIMLLEDMRAIFAELRSERLSSAEIVQALGKMEDRPWSEWRGGSPITVRQLARLLEPFKVAPTKFRAAGYTPGTRGYERAAFADAFVRYLPGISSPSATAPQARESGHSDDSQAPRPGEPVADRAGQRAKETAGCGAVADREGSPAREGAAWTEEDWQALFDERAGIMEFDGGLPRAEAEAHAGDEVARLRREAGLHLPAGERDRG